MIVCSNFPLSLFTLSPPNAYYMSYADKPSFLIHKQQMRLERNLIYLEYSRNGRKLLHSNICRCVRHRHPDTLTLVHDGFVISSRLVLKCFLMVSVNSSFFMPVLCLGYKTNDLDKGRLVWYEQTFILFIKDLQICVTEVSGIFVRFI